MSYTIKKSDGSILLTLGDNRIDQISTSLTLIGKNLDSYGEYLNNDLVGLLENFSSPNEPRSPLVGQLWYNLSEGRMYVYSLDNVFRPVGGIQASPVEPVLFHKGDMWIDTDKNQLFFSSDGENFTLAGPQYSTDQGKTGWVVESILDVSLTPRIVSSLYNQDTLLCISAGDAFSFDSTYQGMSSVQPGLNLNLSIPGIRFSGTATSSDAILNFDPNNFLKNYQNEVTIGTLSILNDQGLTVGSNQDIHLYSMAGAQYIENSITDSDMAIRGINGIDGGFNAITISSNSKSVGIFKAGAVYPLDVYGDTRIEGNLVVQGNITYVESDNLRIKDKNIELAYGQLTPSDLFAEGGGITLIGDTNHNITWTNSFDKSWQINDNFNLVSNSSTYKIGGQTVVTSSTLGMVITSAPGIKKLGVLEYLTVSNIVLSGTTIWATGTNASLNLGVGPGTGDINVLGNKIKNVDNPVDPNDATNKIYVDTTLEQRATKGFAFTIDITGVANVNDFIINYLNLVAPVTNPPADSVYDLLDGIRARILCANSNVNIPTKILNINTTKIVISGQSVVTDVAGTLPGFSQAPTVTYTVKEFRVTGGQWTWYQDIV